MPTSAEALGRAAELQQSGQFEAAELLCREILQAEPNQPDTLNLLGLIAFQTERHDLALQMMTDALASSPENPGFYCNLAKIHQKRGSLEEAAGAYRQALRLLPDIPDANINLGNVLHQQRKLQDLLLHCRRMVRILPDLAIVHFSLGTALNLLTRHDEAVPSLREAIRIEPGVGLAYHNLANALTALGFVEEAQANYRQAKRLLPNSLNTHSSLLFNLHYLPDTTPAQLLAEHLLWQAEHAPKTPPPTSYYNDTDPERRLRVGYVSPDYRNHIVAYFLEPILANHNPARVESFAYAEVDRPDSTTTRLRGLVKHWRSTVGLSDAEVADQVRRDGIDILVDLAGHTSGNRLDVFLHRPAPVQVTYLGYPGTTGLSTLDYQLTDAVADPPAEQASYSEHLVRLPGCFCCYRPSDGIGPVSSLPAHRAGQITFGSTHGLAKLNERVLELWAAVLHAVPSSRLLIYRQTLAGIGRKRLRDLFAAHGIHGDRILMRNLLDGDPPIHLNVYHKIDIALDPFPWAGHGSTCDALWMGVPVLTLRGSRHAGRMTASVLTCLGLTDWIAETPEQYVALAARHAKDRSRLARLRGRLRDIMRTSRLCDGRQFTQGLEEAYRGMWRTWCLRDGERRV